MSTTTETLPGPIPAMPALTRPGLRAGTTIGVHSVCDFFSFISVSLLPLLATRLELDTGQKALLLGMGSIASGLVQPLVAWASDRLDTRALGSIGLGVAVVCISLLGRAQSFEVLVLLHGLGAAGIGAFHPPAAASVGQLSGSRRSIGLAVFFLAGMLGGVLGNVFTPRIVDGLGSMRPLATGAPDTTFGLESLVWLMIPGMAAVVVLGWAIHKAPHRSHSAHDTHHELSRDERRHRWFAVWVLYAANLLRFSVNVAMIYLFAEWAEKRVRTTEGLETLTEAASLQASGINGLLQASMQVGMGAGGLTLGFLLAPRLEKAAFVGFPFIGAGVIALMPFADSVPDGWVVPIMLGLGVLSGVGFGSVIPVSMSLAQRLLPHRTSLASGLMLGGAWAFAFIGPKWAQVVSDRFGLDAGFYVTGVALLVAGLIALGLPQRLIVRTGA